jgi:signal peptidase II
MKEQVTMKTRHRLALMVAVAALAIGFDQATKRIAADTLQFAPPRSYLGDLFRLQYSENPGAFLSLGATLPAEVRTWLFKWGIGALLAGAMGFALFTKRLTPLTVAGLALFVGAGFSNLVDRIIHGDVVIDFMNVGIGRLRSGVFNVADMSIIAGLVLVILGSLVDQELHTAAVENQREEEQRLEAPPDL